MVANQSQGSKNSVLDSRVCDFTIAILATENLKALEHQTETNTQMKITSDASQKETELECTEFKTDW